ncbi:meiotic nuclear division protein 1, partial [Tanacetum coccineum]
MFPPVAMFSIRKGVTVISQSVKDVVQSVADDEWVSKDEIGTSVRNGHERGQAKKCVKETRVTASYCARKRQDAREEALIELKAIEQKYQSES